LAVAVIAAFGGAGRWIGVGADIFDTFGFAQASIFWTIGIRCAFGWALGRLDDTALTVDAARVVAASCNLAFGIICALGWALLGGFALAVVAGGIAFACRDLALGIIGAFIWAKSCRFLALAFDALVFQATDFDFALVIGAALVGT
jgi:hypothetical protein